MRQITNRGGRRIGTSFSALNIMEGVVRGYNVTVVLVKATKESSPKADLADIEQRLRNRVMEKFGKVNEALIAEVMQKVKERMK